MQFDTPLIILFQVGVSQVGARKRILDGILEVHKKQWKMPKDILPYNKSIRWVV